MSYTLYYQQNYRNTVALAVAKSDSLLKLLKIKKMTFRHAKGFSYVIETSEAGNIDAFSYGAGCLGANSYADFMKFNDAVDGGKYFKSYDYSQRVRELLNRRNKNV